MLRLLIRVDDKDIFGTIKGDGFSIGKILAYW